MELMCSREEYRASQWISQPKSVETKCFGPYGFYREETRCPKGWFMARGFVDRFERVPLRDVFRRLLPTERNGGLEITVFRDS